MELTHATLTDLAVKWLRRPDSRNGPGCHIALSECRSGWTGEIPDAIGWRAAGGDTDGCVVVEVKISRSDFLADAKKPHRNGEAQGLGNWRYYLCPEGLIKPDELPPKWGLLYANTRGHIKPMAGPVTIDHYTRRRDALEAMRQPSDPAGERFILVKLFNRVADPEELNRQIRAAYQNTNQLSRELESTKARFRETRRQATSDRMLVRALRDQAPEWVARVEQGTDFEVENATPAVNPVLDRLQQWLTDPSGPDSTVLSRDEARALVAEIAGGRTAFATVVNDKAGLQGRVTAQQRTIDGLLALTRE